MRPNLVKHKDFTECFDDLKQKLSQTPKNFNAKNKRKSPNEGDRQSPKKGNQNPITPSQILKPGPSAQRSPHKSPHPSPQKDDSTATTLSDASPSKHDKASAKQAIQQQVERAMKEHEISSTMKLDILSQTARAMEQQVEAKAEEMTEHEQKRLHFDMNEQLALSKENF